MGGWRQMFVVREVNAMGKDTGRYWCGQRARKVKLKRGEETIVWRDVWLKDQTKAVRVGLGFSNLALWVRTPWRIVPLKLKASPRFNSALYALGACLDARARVAAINSPSEIPALLKPSDWEWLRQQGILRTSGDFIVGSLFSKAYHS